MFWENIISEAIVTKQKPVKKDLIKTKNFNVVVVHLGKNQEILPHPESYAVFFLVLQGSGTFTTKQGNFSLQKGSKHLL
jgi:quercetin dioxygenase-like cupin family protein